MIDNLEAKWPEPPEGTRDRLLHLLDVFEGIAEGESIVCQLDEVAFTMPGVEVPRVALTVGDLRILVDVAVRREYALDGETGSEIIVEHE